MVTIKDIAKKLNLGVSTVSMALNGNSKIKEETRTLVLNAAKELGYVKNGLAVDLQQGHSKLILLVVEDASRPYFSKVIDYIQRRVAYHNFDLLISTTYLKHDHTAKKYISEHRAAGAIVYTVNIDDDFILQYASPDFPIVVMGREIQGEYIQSLPQFQSNHDKSCKITEYLIEHHFHKIAFVLGSLDTLGSIRRLENYLQSLHRAHLDIDENKLFYAEASTYEAGYEVTKTMIERIRKGDIDSIIYANDDIAIGGLLCLNDHDIHVPDDVSIIGGTNLVQSQFMKPALSTLGSNDETLSYHYAVDYLVASILKNDVSLVEQEYQERFKNYKEVIIERETVKLLKKGE